MRHYISLALTVYLAGHPFFVVYWNIQQSMISCQTNTNWLYDNLHSDVVYNLLQCSYGHVYTTINYNMCSEGNL